jgi:hypothetical protein
MSIIPALIALQPIPGNIQNQRFTNRFIAPIPQTGEFFTAAKGEAAPLKGNQSIKGSTCCLQHRLKNPCWL